MKVLITGSTGMIGGHFVIACEKMGWETFGLSRSTSHSRQSPILNHCHHECDILDRGSLRNLLKKLQPDIIIHMAAQAFNGISWECVTIEGGTGPQGPKGEDGQSCTVSSQNSMFTMVCVDSEVSWDIASEVVAV